MRVVGNVTWELRSLGYFVVVAEELNFGRAAQRLHISQPALSQGIKVLERKLGLPLFERSRRRVALTGAGRTLLPKARELLACADELGSLAAALANGQSSRLVLSDTSSAGVGLPSTLVARFRDAHPHTEVVVMTGFSSVNVERVRDRQVDAAFVRPPIDADEDICCVVVDEEPVVLAVAAACPLAQLDRVDREHLAGQQLVFFSPESGGLWHSVLNAVYGPGRYPDISQVEPDEAHMLAAVAQGGGITLLTESAAALLTVPGVVTRPFDFNPTVPLAVAWRQDNSNPALWTFLAEAGIKPRRTAGRSTA